MKTLYIVKWLEHSRIMLKTFSIKTNAKRKYLALKEEGFNPTITEEHPKY